MNEQIKKLAQQAGFQSYITTHEEDVAMFEKFAELLVRECARIAKATPCPYVDEEARQRLGHTWDMANLEAGREIIEKFGV